MISAIVKKLGIKTPDPEKKREKPYAVQSPEDKRRWEQDHGRQRNAQRKKQRLDAKGVSVIPAPHPDCG